MNFTIKTIGCKVNSYESNRIKDELIKLGFLYVDVDNKDEYRFLDVYIVNTCSVTSIADKKSRQMLHLAKKYNPNVIVIAIGCLVDSLTIAANNDSSGEHLQSPHLEGVDYLLSNREKDKLVELIDSFSKDKGVDANNILSDELPTDRQDRQTNDNNSRVRSFIKIQDGCNQYCTYCIIPFLRGSIKSRDNDDIVNEVIKKAKSGVKEIVLTGIHLSSFGLDRVKLQYENNGAIKVARESLLEVMRRIAEIDGIERIRLGSLEPRIIDDEFLKSLVVSNEDVVANENVGANIMSLLPEKFCANFCLSLQSGCDKTLKNMNRHYNTKDFENACSLIRKYLPNATITTDVIVGFPGETDDDFKESLSFVKRMRFYNPNVFPYSRRKGTKADKMDGQLNNKVKHDRAKFMIEECDKISKEIEDEYNKEEHNILIEETFVENGVKYGIGYTKEYIKKKIVIKN